MHKVLGVPPLGRVRFEQRLQHATPFAVVLRARGCARRLNGTFLKRSEERCVSEDTPQSFSAEHRPHVWLVFPQWPRLAPDGLQRDRPRRPFVD